MRCVPAYVVGFQATRGEGGLPVLSTYMHGRLSSPDCRGCTVLTSSARLVILAGGGESWVR